MGQINSHGGKSICVKVLTVLMLTSNFLEGKDFMFTQKIEKAL